MIFNTQAEAQIGQFGICQVNLIPVRTTPSGKAELCTQLIFGDTYKVLEINERQTWYKIKNDYDDYEGWIEAGLYFPISAEVLAKIQANPSPVSTDLVSYLEMNQRRVPIVLGSSLPLLQNNEISLGETKVKFEGKNKNTSEKNDAKALINTALQYLGTPYLWGGKSPFGIDCSGLTQQTFKISGYKIKRDTYQQAEQGNAVDDLTASKSGDLAFFHRENRIIHVGIIVEISMFPDLQKQFKLKANERFIIHALDRVRIDKLDNTGIYNLDKKYYSHYLKTIRRYF